MPNNIYTNILSAKQKELLPLIESFKVDYCLVGGTAIALQIGHRSSIDFDLFSVKNIDQPKIRRTIVKKYKIEKVLVDNVDEYTIIVDGVKITFLHYPFAISPAVPLADYISMPDLKTLGAMKAYALGRRNKWKDYVDLYWIFYKYCKISQIIKKAKLIFGPEFNEKNFREQLVYFRDIDRSEEVDWSSDFHVSDKKIKEFLIEKSLEK